MIRRRRARDLVRDRPVALGAVRRATRRAGAPRPRLAVASYSSSRSSRWRRPIDLGAMAGAERRSSGAAYSNVVFRALSSCGSSIVVERHSRDRHMSGPAAVTVSGPRPTSPVACPHLVGGPFPLLGVRWPVAVVCVLRAGQRRAGRLLFGTAGPLSFQDFAFRWPLFRDILRVSRTPRARHRRHQSHDRDRDGPRRPVRPRGDRRLRHRLAP